MSHGAPSPCASRRSTGLSGDRQCPAGYRLLAPVVGAIRAYQFQPNQAGAGIRAHSVRSDLQHGRLPTITIGHPFASRFPVHPLWLTLGIPLVGSSVAIAYAVLCRASHGTWEHSIGRLRPGQLTMRPIPYPCGYRTASMEATAAVSPRITNLCPSLSASKSKLT